MVKARLKVAIRKINVIKTIYFASMLSDVLHINR
jgi:hypothetical protein